MSQPRIAHFTRTGNLRTPCRASRSPISSPAVSPRIIALNAAIRRPASCTGLPLIRSVIIDADAWLIEHPLPSNRTSCTTPSRTTSESRISSPQSGLAPSRVTVAPSRVPLFRGWL